jgi:hypothetical protein
MADSLLFQQLISLASRATACPGFGFIILFVLEITRLIEFILQLPLKICTEVARLVSFSPPLVNLREVVFSGSGVHSPMNKCMSDDGFFNSSMMSFFVLLLLSRG